MKIDTKFNIGDRVWIVYEHNKEVHVFSDLISDIMISNRNGGTEIKYWLEYADCDYFDEYNLIPYADADMLATTISALDSKIMDTQTSNKGE